jgi:hypothetical protein
MNSSSISLIEEEKEDSFDETSKSEDEVQILMK